MRNMEPIILTFGKNVSTFLKLVTNLWLHLSQASNKSLAPPFSKVEIYYKKQIQKHFTYTIL